MQLTSADIGFDRQVKTKDEALQRVVAALTEAGHTQAAYLQGMREREGQISTYLGNGIAIPHATQCSKRVLRCWLVRRGLTGVRSKPPI